MIRTIKEQAGQAPHELLADSGYCSDESLRYLARTKIDGYIATRKMKHGERSGPAPRGPISRDATRVERMARKVQIQGRRGDLRHTQRHRGTGPRADQAGARLSAVSSARPREGPR